MWTGEKIRALRESQELTQEEFAEALGRHRNAVSYWELGIRKPRASSCRELNRFARHKTKVYFELDTVHEIIKVMGLVYQNGHDPELKARINKLFESIEEKL